MTVDMNKVDVRWIRHGACCEAESDMWTAYDSRGIPLCTGCMSCLPRKLEGYRQDVLYGPTYEADEPIEPED